MLATFVPNCTYYCCL